MNNTYEKHISQQELKKLSNLSPFQRKLFDILYRLSDSGKTIPSYEVLRIWVGCTPRHITRMMGFFRSIGLFSDKGDRKSNKMTGKFSTFKSYTWLPLIFSHDLKIIYRNLYYFSIILLRSVVNEPQIANVLYTKKEVNNFISSSTEVSNLTGSPWDYELLSKEKVHFSSELPGNLLLFKKENRVRDEDLVKKFQDQMEALQEADAILHIKLPGFAKLSAFDPVILRNIIPIARAALKKSPSTADGLMNYIYKSLWSFSEEQGYKPDVASSHRIREEFKIGKEDKDYFDMTKMVKTPMGRQAPPKNLINPNSMLEGTETNEERYDKFNALNDDTHFEKGLSEAGKRFLESTVLRNLKEIS